MNYAAKGATKDDTQILAINAFVLGAPDLKQCKLQTAAEVVQNLLCHVCEYQTVVQQPVCRGRLACRVQASGFNP